MQQVKRFLGVAKAPAWLTGKRHLYPSVDEFEVATRDECDDYWSGKEVKHMQDIAVSAALDNLSRLSTRDNDGM